MANYCSSDWHSAPWAWPIVKEFLKPDDKLYYLGDITGRGAEPTGGWNHLKEMLDDNRIVYIPGNHDYIIADWFDTGDEYLSYINGEISTIVAIDADPEAKNYIKRIKNLPLYVVYMRRDGKKVFMSHSGSINIDDECDLLWDRIEYLTQQNWTDYDYIIHGHSRAKHIMKDLQKVNEFYGKEQYTVPAYTGGAYFYYPWRATVDCGTILSNQITLLNIDTFEEEIFNAPPGVNNLS